MGLAVSLAFIGPANAADAGASAPASSNEDILVIGRADVLAIPTSTGSRLALTALETPARIAVVDGNEIRARGDLTVGDAVTRAPGITSVADPGNGYTALSARGFVGQPWSFHSRTNRYKLQRAQGCPEPSGLGFEFANVLVRSDYEYIFVATGWRRRARIGCVCGADECQTDR